jgi:hypothetical protein
MNAEDDSIDTVYFPLPFRVLALAGLGILGWATNVHGLDVSGIDVVATMDLRAEANTLGHRTPKPKDAYPVYHPVYRIFLVYSAWCLLAWILFRFGAHESSKPLEELGYIPAIAFLGALLALVCPFDVLYKRERDGFLRCVHSSSKTVFSEC